MHGIKIILLFAAIVVAATAIPACSPQAPSTQSQELLDETEQVIAAVNRLIDATNAEDVDAYMAGVHPQSKFSRQEYVDGLRSSFAQFNIHETMSDLTIENLSRDEAKISFTMVVDFNSPDFQNTKITGAYILRKDNGTWKLFDDEIERVEPIK